MAVSVKTEKSSTGYQRKVTMYECKDCSNCPYKKECIKGNNCKTEFKDRNKKLYVSIISAGYEINYKVS